MATTIATMSLSSNDLVTNVLGLSTTSTLTQAGNSTGLVLTSGLARTNFTDDPDYTLVIGLFSLGRLIMEQNEFSLQL